MASQGPLNPGTSADNAGTGSEVWSNVGSPGNVAASDDARCVAALSSANPNSHYLVVTNFGFTIPEGAGAVIDGIEITVERSTNGTTTAQDRFIRIVKTGAIGTTEHAVAVDWSNGGTDTIQTYGSPTDLWGETWVATDINASNFGIAISAKRMTSAPNASVDHVTAKVYYTEAAAGTRPLQSTSVGQAVQRAATF